MDLYLGVAAVWSWVEITCNLAIWLIGQGMHKQVWVGNDWRRTEEHLVGEDEG